MFSKPGPPPKAYTDEYAPCHPNGGRCWTCKRPVEWKKSTRWIRHIHTDDGYVARFFEDFEDCANFYGSPRSPAFSAEFMPKHWATFYWTPDFDISPGHEKCAEEAKRSLDVYLAGQGAPNLDREMLPKEFEERCTLANMPLVLANKCTLAAFDEKRITWGESLPVLDAEGEPVLDDNGKPKGRWDTSQNLISILENWNPKDPALMLCGGVGIGKTHLIAAVATKWIRRRMQVRFHNAANFLSEHLALKFSKNEHDQHRAKLMKDEAQRANLLVIDDLGVSANTKFTDTIWYEILNFRLERGLPTFFTTNLRPQGLEESFNVTFTSRLKEKTRIFLIKGSDYRALGVSRQ